MGSNHTRIGHLITSNMGDNHFGQGRIKGHMQPRDLDQPHTSMKAQQVTNSRECKRVSQAELTRVNKRSLSRDEVILASPTPSRPDQSRLGNPCLAAQQPSREAQFALKRLKTPIIKPQRQLSCHVTFGESTMSLWKIFTGWCTVLHWHSSRFRKCRSETGKPKSARGDRSDY
ncbi:hypothetical protein CR513_49800, partial [Mucuna pruriens]